MNEERLLALIEQDRRAPLPEGPDPRFIAARVRVQLGTEPAQTANGEVGALVALTVLGSLVPMVWALYARQYGWLALWPTFLLLFTPLVIRKGANR